MKKNESVNVGCSDPQPSNLGGSEILKKVNDALDALPYDRRPQSLYEPIRYVLSLGGKRIRPVLMLLGYNLFKDDPERIMMQALGVETYHNYTLLHDDLMDNADLRRGNQTVHKRWDANKAILSGDSMLVLAYQRVAQCDSKHLPAVLNLFTETALEIGEGQEYDMSFETRNDVTEEEYIEMIRLKTSVLLACALKMGAILADASDADAENLYRFGEQIGLAFQLQDDLLDVYGDPKVFGKAIGGDITSNKKTYMLINAVNRANAAQREELMRWIEAKDFDRQEKINAVTRLYDEIGIRQLCEEKINYYFEEGKKYLEKVEVPAERKKYLQAYVNEMMHREF
jgi:geranylgeranyl diphosphate synthase type II